jgi:hypothetical protein
MRPASLRSALVLARLARSRRWIALGVGVMAVASLTALVSVSHRAVRWDPRLLDVVRFVEAHEGHRFRHAVPVSVLPPPAFARAMGRPPAPLTVTSLDRTVSVLRAFGVISGPVDVADAVRRFTADSVIGLYDRSAGRVFVQDASPLGGVLSPAGRATLVHELTHALQDQDGNLGAIGGAAGVPDAVARAVIEGDAVAAEQDYVRTLPPADAASYRAARTAQASQVSTGLPAGLADHLSFPYLFGPAFASAVRQQTGTAGLDRAFRHPPTTEGELINPARYLHRVRTSAVANVVLPAGAVALGATEPFGQVSLFEVLGSRLGYRDAMGAVSDWQADRLVLYRLPGNGRDCAAVAVRLGTAATAERFARTAGQWAAAAGGTVSPLLQDRVVQLGACDAGSSAPPQAPVQPPPYRVLALRASLLSFFATQHGAGAAAAACAADHLIDLAGPAALMSYDEGTALAMAAGWITAASAGAMSVCGVR